MFGRLENVAGVIYYPINFETYGTFCEQKSITEIEIRTSCNITKRLVKSRDYHLGVLFPVGHCLVRQASYLIEQFSRSIEPQKMFDFS